MERIPLRELRNQASRVVRLARAGERFVITVDGVPAAQIGPVDTAGDAPTVARLITQGRLLAPRLARPPLPAAPMELPEARPLSEIVLDGRDG